MTSIDTNSKAGRDELPDQPVLVIRARGKSLAVSLKLLWKYRELIYILTLRDVKVRYKQTVLGILWAIIQPLFMMVIFTFFFGRLAGVPSEGVPYPIFAYTGLLLWTFFSNALNSSANSLIRDSSLITKIYFPRMIIPLAAVGASLIDFFIAFGLLALLMIYYGTNVSAQILILPVFVGLTVFLAAGAGMWLAALNVKYRDIRYVLPFAIQVGLFVTPVIYPTDFVPEKWRWLLMLNPLTGLIEGFRSSIFGKPFDPASIGISFVVISFVMIFSFFAFRRMEREFADIV